jgi:5-formyltetrahydrofolate cyclo-ligase
MTVGDKSSGEALDAAAEARRAIMAWRREQRAGLIAARIGMPADAHRKASRLIRERLRAYLQQHEVAVLGGYWPIQREFNVLLCLAEQVARGGRAALPFISAEKQPLEFRLWTPGACMAVGVYDIPYPVEGAAVRPNALLVPMLGFDADGFRLGYGGGYYDRTAAALMPRPRLIGIAFESAQLPSIRPLPHDIPMDCIITEHTTRIFGADQGLRSLT